MMYESLVKTLRAGEMGIGMFERIILDQRRRTRNIMISDSKQHAAQSCILVMPPQNAFLMVRNSSFITLATSRRLATS
jgi:hypothetical protein